MWLLLKGFLGSLLIYKITVHFILFSLSINKLYFLLRQIFLILTSENQIDKTEKVNL